MSGIEVPGIVSNPDVRELIENPPPPGGVNSEDGGKDRFWHIVYRTGFIVAVIAFVVAAIAGSFALVSYASSQASAKATKEQSACINRILADRNGTSAADEAAHLTWATDIDVLTAVPSSATETQKIAAVNLFVQQTQQYQARLASDEAYRESHPLGKC